MEKKVLITGASGLLGRAIYRLFEEDPTWEALGLAFSRAKGKLCKVDLTDPQALEKVVDEFKPSFIIHSAAERRPDMVEKQEEQTKNLNVMATKNLCQAAVKNNAWLLYMSTDYVFDGKSPPYSVDAKPNPLNKYGQSKLDGEKVVLECNKDFGILRVPILYGELEFIKESAVTELFTKLTDTSKSFVVSDYEQRHPTHTRDVAKVIRQMLEKKLEGQALSGVFHWSGNEKMTKYGMICTMASVFNLPHSHIQGDNQPTAGAPRPYDAELDSSRLQSLNIGSYTLFGKGVHECLEPFYKQGT
ncbi:methionine adenosyltransferase 2 subunit beta-like [Lingula anatina]|uniref:Methionine adenosyltransferase 2 subunit beta n=1 Tax=Lingula anatina TaxID=7574 RepID=A0A1S3HVJ6_LINAN|nr:methionine adenosyltransferase 2 subunit beta-like [Lingula anatina]XP_013390068.1 methionine adenosyltransferase 2 subunit beta-like [Lingula anatina]|eukprot:XP_013390060.1 methionine adenosyltransferase 2 subunit beta-like [Lingula anatina]